MPSVIATLQSLVAEQQATIVDLRAVNARLEERVRDLETRVGQHSGNSSRPPSSDLPGTPKRLPSRPSGRGRGGQPGHVAHQRAMAPPERVDVVTDHWPLHCQAYQTVLPQTLGLPGVARAPDFVAHQVTELPVIHPRITEHRLHRNRSRGSVGDAHQLTGSATSGAIWGQAGAGRSWGTARSAMFAVQTPAR